MLYIVANLYIFACNVILGLRCTDYRLETGKSKIASVPTACSFVAWLQPNTTIFGLITTMIRLIYIRLFNEYLFSLFGWELSILVVQIVLISYPIEL